MSWAGEALLPRRVEAVQSQAEKVSVGSLGRILPSRRPHMESKEYSALDEF